ncbi:MAG: outer membrane beta-barrel protein [Candidatus Binataceae bacterium]
MLFASSLALAAGPTGGTSASEQARLDALSGNITNLAGEVTQTQGEVKTIEKAITVAPPAEGAQPQTVGEHVSVVEKDLGDLKTDLNTRLGISIHGLVDAGYEHNFNQPNGNTNLYHAWDVDGFSLTQGNIHIEKDGTVGFVTDINVGQVANSISSVTNYGPNSTHVGNQWIDPTQYYLTYTAPLGSGVSIQGGRFVTLLGAEIIPTYTNQNYNETRGLLFTLGEPLTHTGFQAGYTFNDYVAFTGSLNNGWDDPTSWNNGGPNYEGELTLNTKDKSLTFVLNGIWGPNLPESTTTPVVGHSNSNLGAIDPILTYKPTFVQNVTLEAEYLYASETGPVVNGHSATWQGLAGYFVYDWNAWEAATRSEFFDDEDGARTGTAQTLWEITQTVTWKIPEVTGLLARLEYRHDSSDTHVFPNNNFVTVNPLTGVGSQQLWTGQDTLSANMIYAF